MAAALLPDPLWDLVEPFLPIPPRRPQGGRPRVSDRACLTGIVFVLRSGNPWQMLPQELGYRAVARRAPHRAWEWPGPVAVGRGAHLCLAQSVSSLARAV